MIMTQIVDIIDCETMVSLIRGPMITIPRNSESVVLRDMHYTVTDVVFDFQEVKRIGVKAKAELAIRVYVKRD
jgi:hypothetical protein